MSSQSGGEAVDLARLREVSGGDEEFEQILMAAFLEDADGQFAAIETAVAAKSRADLAAAAHSLKGSSANMGAAETSNICLALERVDPQEDPGGAGLLVEQLRNELDRVRTFIDALMA